MALFLLQKLLGRNLGSAGTLEMPTGTCDFDHDTSGPPLWKSVRFCKHVRHGAATVDFPMKNGVREVDYTKDFTIIVWVKLYHKDNALHVGALVGSVPEKGGRFQLWPTPMY